MSGFETRGPVVASMRATNLATHLPNLATHLSKIATHLHNLYLLGWLITYCLLVADAAEVHLDERERYEPRGGAAEPGAGAPHVTPHQEHK
jgi:hypothetical protein